ncbi:HAUS augmin-like complex subunit 3 [Plakobranchus ocellatus]|uniref:HAUS augmin-like complex subunit 3 n=1 Tax=Plakobranchus ocellatus TaxID=259542 RepID=A0AAV3YIL9_9GAST|nr:HAUS augmin-like complex subunit 3 [Plakobranchus ocellatus]
MDSHKFSQVLHNIGYPNAHKLDPQALEWAFENSATVPFLNWFLNSVAADNVVSTDDLHEFKHIKDSGGLIEGLQLDEALKNIENEGPGNDSLESEVDKLQKALVQATARKQSLLSHCNKLSVQQVGLQNKVMKMKEVEEQADRNLKQVTDKCAMQDVKINKALQSLAGAIGRLGELYKNKSEGKGKMNSSSEDHFLSQLDLSAFHDAEAKYSHDLTAFTKKQFFEFNSAAPVKYCRTGSPLTLWYSSVGSIAGFCKEAFRSLKRRVTGAETGEQVICTLMLDEMAIKKHV